MGSIPVSYLNFFGLVSFLRDQSHYFLVSGLMRCINSGSAFFS